MSEIERAIQFLVCPQRDFIGWLEPGCKPPNRLHVGGSGVQKLRGEPGGRDHFVEMVRRLYDPAIPGVERLRVVIDEDWHPRRCEEFPIYGEHCVKGSKGAELVGGLEAYRWHPRTYILRANSVNVAASPRYADVVRQALGEARVEATRAGIFGVWTHVKVEQLAVNLRTHAPHFGEIGILETLCASPDRADHAAAVKKLKQMGFHVFEDEESYCAWLGLDLDPAHRLRGRAREREEAFA